MSETQSPESRLPKSSIISVEPMSSTATRLFVYAVLSQGMRPHWVDHFEESPKSFETGKSVKAFQKTSRSSIRSNSDRCWSSKNYGSAWVREIYKRFDEGEQAEGALWFGRPGHDGQSAVWPQSKLGVWDDGSPIFIFQEVKIETSADVWGDGSDIRAHGGNWEERLLYDADILNLDVDVISMIQRRPFHIDEADEEKMRRKELRGCGNMVGPRKADSLLRLSWHWQWRGMAYPFEVGCFLETSGHYDSKESEGGSEGMETRRLCLWRTMEWTRMRAASNWPEVAGNICLLREWGAWRDKGACTQSTRRYQVISENLQVKEAAVGDGVRKVAISSVTTRRSGVATEAPLEGFGSDWANFQTT